MIRYYLLIILLILPLSIGAQNPLERKIDFEIFESSLSESLIKLSLESKINIAFSDQLITESRLRITQKFTNTTIKNILNLILEDHDLTYTLIGEQIVLIPGKNKQRQKYSISGYIEDAETGERLIGAYIYCKDISKGTTSNEYGFYSFSLNKNLYEITCSYLGYQPATFTIDLNKNIKNNFSLSPSVTLKEVVIYSTRKGAKLKNLVDLHDIHFKQISNTPTLGGEQDLVRYIHTLSGVKSGGDGVGGLFVRGGNADQNLILLDGVPVYHPSHSGGLFSIFNTRIIKSSNLYKGSFPARYGGRISSVLDVRMKDGNNKSMQGEVSIGLVSANVTAEGPITKDKASYIVSYRRSILDPWIKTLSSYINQLADKEGETRYFYQDLNAKVNAIISQTDRMYLSYYQGRDDFESFTSRTVDADGLFIDEKRRQTVNWGNIIGAFRWNHLFSDKFFSNTTLTYSQFDFFSSEKNALVRQSLVSTDTTSNFIQYKSNIVDLGIRFDMEYIANDAHRFRAGLGGLQRQFNPRLFALNEDSNLPENFLNVESTFSDSIHNLLQVKATELSAYIEDELSLGTRIRFNIGLHMANFLVQTKTYTSIQPRFSARFKLHPRAILNASYAQMSQYLHILSNGGFGLPNEFWVPATSKIEPQESQQYSLGFNIILPWDIDFVVNGYFKKMKNLITYREGASFIVGGALGEENVFSALNWENKVTKGEGESKGIEFELSKTFNNLDFSANYTYSITNRTFENINRGETYPFRYDKQHALNIFSKFQFNDHLSASVFWTYHSGNAITIPQSQFTILPEDVIVLNFKSKNGFRTQAYHRLDLSVKYKRFSKKFRSEFDIGFYNIYNRSNPLYYYLKKDPLSKPSYKKVTLVPILPSIRYTLIL